jgi:hypothetical protein
MITDDKQLKTTLAKWQQTHYRFHEERYKAKKEQLRKDYEKIVVSLKQYWEENKKKLKGLKWTNYLFEKMLTSCPTAVLRMHVADSIHEIEDFLRGGSGAELVRKRANNKGKKENSPEAEA